MHVLNFDNHVSKFVIWKDRTDSD